MVKDLKFTPMEMFMKALLSMESNKDSALIALQMGQSTKVTSTTTPLKDGESCSFPTAIFIKANSSKIPWKVMVYTNQNLKTHNIEVTTQKVSNMDKAKSSSTEYSIKEYGKTDSFDLFDLYCFFVHYFCLLYFYCHCLYLLPNSYSQSIKRNVY
jgi:hypothetical protein